MRYGAVTGLATAVLFITVGIMTADSQAPQKKFALQDGDRIVFLGDSITQQGGEPEGYVSLIELFFGVNGLEVEVINAGIGGHKSNDMLVRLQTDVLDHKPTWVSISCGVNDVWHGEKGVPLPEYKKNMTDIVDRCLDAKAKVLLLTATPIYEDLNSPENQKLRAYNEFLRELAKEKQLLLCDLFAAFETEYLQKLVRDNLLTTDGVHMKPRGNRLMARTILQTLGAGWSMIGPAENRWELIDNMWQGGYSDDPQ